MLIGLAGTAQAETKIIYPPYSYQPPMKLCDYILGGTGGCGYHHGYGHGHRYYDDNMMAAAVHGEAYAKTAKVVVILPSSTGE
jgi:hypothetical protein